MVPGEENRCRDVIDNVCDTFKESNLGKILLKKRKEKDKVRPHFIPEYVPEYKSEFNTGKITKDPLLSQSCKCKLFSNWSLYMPGLVGEPPIYLSGRYTGRLTLLMTI